MGILGNWGVGYCDVLWEWKWVRHLVGIYLVKLVVTVHSLSFGISFRPLAGIYLVKHQNLALINQPNHRFRPLAGIYLVKQRILLLYLR